MIATAPKEAYADGGEFKFDVDTLWERMEQMVNLYPNDEAFVVKGQSNSYLAQLRSPGSVWQEGPDARWTYSDMEYASRLLALSFTARGVGPGDVCIVLAENSVEWGLMFWTTIRAGFTLAALDSHMNGRPQELALNLQRLKPKAVVVIDEIAARNVDAAGATATVKLVSQGASPSSAWTAFKDFGLASEDSTVSLAPVPLDEVLQIVFTSGTTTGKPKGCPLTHRNLYTTVRNLHPSFNVRHETRYLQMGVTFRSMLSLLGLMQWTAGAVLVTTYERFTAELAIDAIVSERCTMLGIVPSNIHSIGDRAALQGIPLQSHMESVTVGADIIDRELVRRTKAIFGEHIDFRTGHGMTEGAAVLGWRPGFDSSKIPTNEGGILSIGQTLPGGKARIVDKQTGEVLLRGQKGELHVSSPAHINAYMEGINPTDFYTDKYGQWFKTGDVAVMDDQGFFFILGRDKDVIKYKGVSLSPGVLEGVLNKVDDVKVKVVGLAEPSAGAIPIAVVQCGPEKRNDTVKKQLIETSIQELGIDYGLHRVYFVQELGLQKFPLNDTGKVQRIELIELIKQLPKA